MLAEGALQVDVEQVSSRYLSVWRKVYNTMRCPGLPCKKGPHYWVDPIGKKHYPLNTRHLKSLIMYVQEGHILETHDDVPENVREELYAEEQKSLERHQKASRTSIASLPLIISQMCYLHRLVSNPTWRLQLELRSRYDFKTTPQ